MEKGSPKLVLRAATVRVILDARGRPLVLSARGGVLLSLGRRQGRAREATFDVPQRRIVLLGGPELSCPRLGLRLRGKRIAIALESGQLSVDDVRADLEVGRHGQR